MMFPHGANMFSMSCCVMFFGRPLMYRFAPLMLSLLGRATDTCSHKKSGCYFIPATKVQDNVNWDAIFNRIVKMTY